MKAISFGEVLWDIIEGKEYLGGAPFNLAAHLAKLGCSSSMISRIGKDRRGKNVLQKMALLGVDSSLIQIDSIHPTGTVNVVLSKEGQPIFRINEEVAYDFIELQNGMLKTIRSESFDAFCFGTLVQRSEITRNTLYELLRNASAKHFLYDVNLRQNFYSKEIISETLTFSTIVKLNEEEVRVLSPLLFGKELSNRDFASEITRSFCAKIICITKGENGCAIYYNGEVKEIPGINVRVVDTVGSGDAFSAGFLFKYCNGLDPFKSAEFANILGAFVASKSGAIPEYDSEIRKLIEST